MASINQIVSEIVHSLGQPNNFALRENIRSVVVHTRNELIRHSYEQHGYIDSVMQYRYGVSLINVKDGDIELPEELNNVVGNIKRTFQKVPRPIRLTNNLPFTRISSRGYKTNVEIPYIKETTARFRQYVPGLNGMDCYDYINDYVYIFPSQNSRFNDISSIVIESAFEHPTEVQILDGNGAEYDFMNYDNEWLIPEDMIGNLKDIIFKRELVNIPRENNELSKSELLK